MAQFTRDRMSTGWDQVPNGLWTLPVAPGARCLLGWLHSHSDEFLARLTINKARRSMRTSSVREHLDALSELGFVTVTTAGKGEPASFHLHGEPYLALCNNRAGTGSPDLEPTEPESDHPRADSGPPTEPESDHRGRPLETDHLRQTNVEASPSTSLVVIADEVEVLDPTQLEREARRLEAHELCEFMVRGLEHIGYSKTPTITETWITDMERMVRIDNRDPDVVKSMIRWLYADTSADALFWQKNIASPAKLREKWERLALVVRQTAAPKKQKLSKSGRNAIYARRMAELLRDGIDRDEAKRIARAESSAA